MTARGGDGWAPPSPAAPACATIGRMAASRPTLFQRLFWTYAVLLGIAVAALILAPVTVSVPIAVTELLVLLGAFVLMLVVYRLLLGRALAPLARLTVLMGRVDPFSPGQRIAEQPADREVAALTHAFNDMLDRLEGERRESARRALAAQEAERKRIARELHDEIGQILTGLVLRSESLARRAPDELRGDLEELREAARAGAEEVRGIAQRLRPEALDELGLQSALLALTTDVGRRAGLDIERQMARDLPLSAEQELVIYRVAQESLTNIVRHAGARHAWLRLGADAGGGVELEVRDDGDGLPPAAERSSSGIRGMRERALLAGGRLTIGAAEPRGTVVRLRLPPEELS